jgi:hypothetical protein
VLFCCGGPLAQADFDGSWGGFLKEKVSRPRKGEERVRFKEKEEWDVRYKLRSTRME